MEATQESTQPYTDPRRGGLNNSGLLEEDLSDVVCILHPSSPQALDAVAATARVAPWHILQKDVLEYGVPSTAALDIALRLSSNVNDPARGFCFGRTLGRSDILLCADNVSKRISNTHFRIYITNDSILMLEDVSTNGTIVDNCRLKKREKENSRMLTNGSVISVVNGDYSTNEVKFVVRLPNREGFTDIYNQNLQTHLGKLHGGRPGTVQQGRRQPSGLSIPSWNSHGMHWSGGPTYNVTGQIGKGAFAVVYKLATRQHGAVYAAKELDKRRFMKNGILDQKVDNELKIMKDLKHPNIVQYIDHHEHDRWIYIIMEYVPCGELSTYLHNMVNIPEDMVKTIARQVLHALKYLHKRRITHRDIKPDNILIASHEPLKVKLSDFGLSKVTQEETFLKTFCGTLLYCAPEVYPEYDMYRRGEVRKRRRAGDPAPKTSPYDQSVDMYSLGAVLFHLLAGIPPYTGRGDDRGAQMLRTIMTTEPDFDVLRTAGVSEAGVDLVSKLLNRDPLLRPKERECLKHPWLVDVPDIDVYEDDGLESDYSDGLSAIGEVAEDDLDASQLSLEENLDFEEEPAENGSDLAQSKRPRIDSPPADIRYPSLPSLEVSQHPQQPSQVTPRRLFGEITSSALRSSHALGDNMDAIQDGSHSVQDFISSAGESMISYGNSLNSVLSLPENPVAGSALSLLGAENLVRQLNMNSWHPGTSRNPLLSTETASPQPNDGDGLVDDQVQEEIPHAGSLTTPKAAKFSRRIELQLPDTASERSSSDDSNIRIAGGRSRNSTREPGEIFDIELANTIDAKTGLAIPDDAESKGFEPPADPSQAGGPVATPRPLPIPGKSRPLLGKLTTLPGSIFDLTLRLENRMTSWGRGPLASICYPDPFDARIPAYALEVTFWAPRLEERVASGQDWMTIPGTTAQLSTKTRRCIWVNDVELKKGPEGNLHFGRLYTGDIITVYRHRNKFLKFKCEFYHGDSARERPEHEKGFAVRKVLTSKNGAVNQQPVRRNPTAKK
ncbi:serine/threonine-protein kinase [Aspergillus mulundensis]|uniref:Serine/threonine-protein kinase ATG1 n=1 Tax=Aspergillus mulundensis TaxID=1810919 RepID=A0A3D8RKT8_9EURO|nr:Protein kinase [Aspergillus mulundensis]RDW74570.1 Protein kinase [Aspergillus mulundensis]